MKRIISVLMAVALMLTIMPLVPGTFEVSATSGDVEINETNFPNETFRNYVSERFDDDGDGIISSDTLSQTIEMYLEGKEIDSLSGIEYFTALEYLDCNNNNLTGLDLSNNTLLKHLDCSNNNLTGLDLSNNTELEKLKCKDNSLAELDLSNNTKLETLEISGCYDDSTPIEQRIFDFSNFTALKKLYCNSNSISTLNVSQNTELEVLSCHHNNLTALDLSKNTKLKVLDCRNNKISALDLSKNVLLEDLTCGDNGFLAGIDLSKNTALKYLLCFNNNLSELDLSNNTALKELWCFENHLTQLDLSNNTEFEELDCRANSLTALDLSNNTALKSLICSNNPLTSLDVSENTALTDLECTQLSVCSAPQISMTPVNGKIDLSWTAVDGASVYEVYRATSVSGDYTLLASTESLTYSDSSVTNGTTYYYKVKAVPNSGYCCRSFSNVLGFTCTCDAPIVKMTRVSGKPKLSWNAVNGASKYEVYRATSKTGTYTLLATTTGTSCSNSGASAGVTYYYKVRAINKDASYANSAYSEIKSFTCTCTTPSVSISRVSGTTSSGTKYTGKPKLTWKAVTGASKYEIYRATSKTGTYSKIATTTSTSYINSGASAGKTYYYKVKAISKDSTYANSAYSSMKTFTCTCSTPSVSIALSSNKPKLTWKAITGASKYEVYRATSKSGSYSKIATTTSLSYRDSKASSSKTYYYKVKAISKDSTYANSAYSSIKSIKSK